MAQTRKDAVEMISAYSVVYSAAAQAVYAIIQEDVNAELVGEIAAAVGAGVVAGLIAWGQRKAGANAKKERDIYWAAMDLGKAELRMVGLRGKGDYEAYRGAMESTESARGRLTVIARSAGMQDFETWVVGHGRELVIVTMRGSAGAGANLPDRVVVWDL
jgi:hypothetical protein